MARSQTLKIVRLINLFIITPSIVILLGILLDLIFFGYPVLIINGSYVSRHANLGIAYTMMIVMILFNGMGWLGVFYNKRTYLLCFACMYLAVSLICLFTSMQPFTTMAFFLLLAGPYVIQAQLIRKEMLENREMSGPSGSASQPVGQAQNVYKA